MLNLSIPEHVEPLRDKVLQFIEQEVYPVETELLSDKVSARRGQLMRSLMDLTHRIALAQVSGSEAEASTAEERVQLTEWAGRLEVGQVHRLWQLLLKGHDEVRQAPDPLVSARMALLRVLHASNLPDPGKLAKKLEELAARGPAPAATSGENAAPTINLPARDSRV